MKLEILPLLISLIPSLFLTLLALYYFKLHTDNEEKRRRYLMHKDNQKQSLPLRLQAYERMALFLERISPGKLLLRTTPLDDDIKSYESLLINTIEQEFDHNLTQQIYISDECWNIVKSAKNGTIALIRKTILKEEVDSVDKMRQTILTEIVEKGSPSDSALTAIKREVEDLW
ncbi:hypothetical protein [Aquimarina sp. RZ0]|uniref:DUF7935 family protein n=1 Tax=Aquimarina sp. RZ0 TaxID=2607730 RepID=UPI0011F0BFD5|nr:hypothetical protein [Aquimarina sp. RZ0]KAA1246099.1 hypothetical protein F0000_08940 [Aquimarina sp. RZ0]